MPPMFSELGKPRSRSNALYDDFLYQLSGRNAVRVYEEMSKNDATVRSVLFAIENTAREVDWTVEPADETPAALEIAEFVEDCLHDMRTTWDEFLSGVFTMLVYGFSFFETVMKRRPDGRIGWLDHAFRGQQTLVDWQLDEAGRPEAFIQYVDNQKITIPIAKGLLFRTQTIGRPEGESILRGVYRSWWYKKRLEEIEGIGAERDLAGLPLIGIPLQNAVSGSGDDIYDWAVKTATRVKRDEQEGIVYPLVFDENGKQILKVELLSAAGGRQFDTNTIITRYNQAIAQVALADFILLGHSNVGSRALADPKIGLFNTAMGAWLDSIEETLNRHAVPLLLKVNSITADPPKIKHGEIREPDLTIIGTFLKDTAQAGLPWFGQEEQADLELVNIFRNLIGAEPLETLETPEVPEPEPPQGSESEGAMNDGRIEE